MGLKRFTSQIQNGPMMKKMAHDPLPSDGTPSSGYRMKPISMPMIGVRQGGFMMTRRQYLTPKEREPH